MCCALPRFAFDAENSPAAAKRRRARGASSVTYDGMNHRCGGCVYSVVARTITRRRSVSFPTLTTQRPWAHTAAAHNCGPPARPAGARSRSSGSKPDTGASRFRVAVGRGRGHGAAARRGSGRGAFGRRWGRQHTKTAPNAVDVQLHEKPVIRTSCFDRGGRIRLALYAGEAGPGSGTDKSEGGPARPQSTARLARAPRLPHAHSAPRTAPRASRLPIAGARRAAGRCRCWCRCATRLSECRSPLRRGLRRTTG
jgi:hypothetical protein